MDGTRDLPGLLHSLRARLGELRAAVPGRISGAAAPRCPAPGSAALHRHLLGAAGAAPPGPTAPTAAPLEQEQKPGPAEANGMQGDAPTELGLQHRRPG